MREYFHLRPQLTTAQFLQEVRTSLLSIYFWRLPEHAYVPRLKALHAQGYAERKVLLLLSVIERCKACHADIKRRTKVCINLQPIVSIKCDAL